MRPVLLLLIFSFSLNAFADETYWQRRIDDFEFENKDLRTVINKVGKMTGMNFVIDPGVKGKISIKTNSQTTVRGAYKAFLDALALNGFTIIQSGDYYRVLTSRNAQRDNLPIYINEIPPDENRMVTMIFTFKHANAQEVFKHLRILPSRDGEISVMPGDKQLVLSDYGGNLQRIFKILKHLDQPKKKKR